MIAAAPQLLSPNDDRYPASLKQVFGGLLPPDLWFIGNLELLEKRGVGFCGSRHATENGLKASSDCARQLGEGGVAVISGYAAGVDMAAHEAALNGGGATIVVLAEGIDNFRIKKSIKESWDWQRVLVLSHYPRNAVWRADRAMDRNKVIVALSDAVIVVEAREQGGTLNAGYCALKMHRPLFVAVYSDMNGAREGNRQLLEEGGVPLRRSRTSDQAQLGRLFRALQNSEQHA